MAVNIRTKYYGNPNLSNRNRPYKFQLDYNVNGKRVRRTIQDVIFRPTDTKEERQQKQRIINRIKSQLEIELGNSKNGLVSLHLQKANFISYFENLASKKSLKTKTAWDNTLRHLKLFHGKKIKFEDVTVQWLENFIKYLEQEGLSINSICTYFHKISAALNCAKKERIILENPTHFVNKPRKTETSIVYLTQEELKTVINTEFYDDEVKNAFLLSCYTGLRVSDIKKLKWKHIEGDDIHLVQTKTKNAIYIPLNENAKGILKAQEHNRGYIFNLSKYETSINRTLKKLIKISGISKPIHFHCARHTFATLLASNGVSIFTISKLMGHRDIKSTLVYAKLIDKEKQRAVNSMPLFTV